VGTKFVGLLYVETGCLCGIATLYSRMAL